MTQKEFDRLMLKRVDTIGLSVRAYSCLRRSGKDTIKDLVVMTEDDLMGTRNLGKSCLKEIVELIRSLGLDIRPYEISKEEWLEELKEKLVKKEIETQEQTTNDEKNSMRIIAKLLEIWDADIENEVQKLIDRNI